MIEPGSLFDRLVRRTADVPPPDRADPAGGGDALPSGADLQRIDAPPLPSVLTQGGRITHAGTYAGEGLGMWLRVFYDRSRDRSLLYLLAHRPEDVVDVAVRSAEDRWTAVSSGYGEADGAWGETEPVRLVRCTWRGTLTPGTRTVRVDRRRRLHVRHTGDAIRLREVARSAQAHPLQAAAVETEESGEVCRPFQSAIAALPATADAQTVRVYG
jgi:hypothetical protein